jgi:hypothetical protein
MEYARQYNNPHDLHRAGLNARKVEQQHYLSQLSGGSWSQPPWDGWKPIYGAGVSGGSHFLQRYAQDGDSGFFHRGTSLFGRGEPLGANALPLNHLSDEYVEPQQYDAPTVSTIEPVITQPSAKPEIENIAIQTTDAEPQQHAIHVPPYSHLMKVQGMGKDGALYQEPLTLPEKTYGGSFHRKRNVFGKK